MCNPDHPTPLTTAQTLRRELEVRLKNTHFADPFGKRTTYDFHEKDPQTLVVRKEVRTRREYWTATLEVSVGEMPNHEFERQFWIVVHIARSLESSHKKIKVTLPLDYLPKEEQEDPCVNLNRALTLETPVVESRFDYVARRAQEEADRINRLSEESKWKEDLPGFKWETMKEVKVKVSKNNLLKVLFTDRKTGRKYTERVRYTDSDLDGKTLKELEDEVSWLLCREQCNRRD